MISWMGVIWVYDDFDFDSGLEPNFAKKRKENNNNINNNKNLEE